LTLLLVEQNAHAAMEISDRSYVMENRAVMMGGWAGLMMSPEVRAAYP
jgi:branched-chain amino acid transport system ATP-binding protein